MNYIADELDEIMAMVANPNYTTWEIQTAINKYATDAFLAGQKAMREGIEKFFGNSDVEMVRIKDELLHSLTLSE